MGDGDGTDLGSCFCLNCHITQYLRDTPLYHTKPLFYRFARVWQRRRLVRRQLDRNSAMFRSVRMTKPATRVKNLSTESDIQIKLFDRDKGDKWDS